MDPSTLLQTHAEMSIALAGFASVIAALSRPLSAFARQRFLSLLAMAVILILGCLLPLWVLDPAESQTAAWRGLSILLVCLNASRLWWLVIVPNRSLDAGERMILSPFANKVVWTTGYASMFFLLFNSIGIPFPPSFDLYYASLLASLVIGFALFADVALGDS